MQDTREPSEIIKQEIQTLLKDRPLFHRKSEVESFIALLGLNLDDRRGRGSHFAIKKDGKTITFVATSYLRHGMPVHQLAKDLYSHSSISIESVKDAISHYLN